MNEEYIDDLLNNITLNADINFELFKEVVLSKAFIDNIDLIKSTRRSNISEVESSCLLISKSFLKSFDLNLFIKKNGINFDNFMVEVRSFLYTGTPLHDQSNISLIKTFLIKQTQCILYTIILDLPKNYVFQTISFNNKQITA